jgi:anti-sigma B factor antagonist
MTIEENLVGGVTVFRLTGDFISEPDQFAFQQKVRDVARTGMSRLVVDLRGVHYINSCGIGSLVGALTTLRRGGGEIYLAGTTREVRSVFETAQLQLIFHFHSTVDDAVSAVARATA